MYGEIQFLNLNGQVILRANSASKKTEIETDQLQEGMYLLQLNGQTIGKVIKF
jgi:hypothetical protein